MMAVHTNIYIASGEVIDELNKNKRGDGVAERSKAQVATHPAPVRFLVHGWHFSSSKSRCPENRCR